MELFKFFAGFIDCWTLVWTLVFMIIIIVVSDFLLYKLNILISISL